MDQNARMSRRIMFLDAFPMFMNVKSFVWIKGTNVIISHINQIGTCVGS